MPAAAIPANRAEYERRINRVADYVSRHLSDELTIEILAGVAAFSPFHFHRVFLSVTGETLGDFIQRLRLEHAACTLLRQPRLEITHIALDCGFGSSAAFAHAFKSRFGMSATRWRNEGNQDLRAARLLEYSNLNQAYSNFNQAAPCASGQNRVEDICMNVSVTSLPDFHVACMRNVGPYGPTQIPALWGKLMAWAGPRGLMTPDFVSLGISYDDPHVTPPEKCRYDACIVVPAGFPAESSVVLKDIPGGRYAVYAYEGSAAGIMEPWRQIFTTWLPSSGFQPDDRPCFELYRGDHFDPAKQVFRCEICIPVKPL